MNCNPITQYSDINISGKFYPGPCVIYIEC